MNKDVTDNNKLFTVFRQSGEVSFIKFLDKLGESNVEETTNSSRPKRQSNKRLNKRQEQTLQGSKEI